MMVPLLRSLVSKNATTYSIARKASAFHRRSKKYLQDRTLAARCYFYDFSIERQNLNWKRNGQEYWKLSAELIFQFHKLEKGLCLPGKKRFFGRDAVTATMKLMNEWRSSGFPMSHPVYIASVETLRAYRTRLDLTPPPDEIRDRLVADVESFLTGIDPVPTSQTPIPTTKAAEHAYDELLKLAIARRSVRSFSDRPVEFSLIEKSLVIAQLSPSACNRQPWRVHLYSKKEDIDKLLELQNGNTGFREEIPLLAVIAADMNCFFDASERIEPVLDSGLFLMSFLLSLQSVGLSSCCLNWCVPPHLDILAHDAGNIPTNHKISTFLAIGYASDHAIVPLSARRPTQDVFVKH